MVWINEEFWLLMIYILIGIYFIIFYKEFGWVLYVLVLGDVKLFNVN